MAGLALHGGWQVLGRLPLGNNGRSHVNAFRPMTVAPELMATIRQFQPPHP